MKQMRQGGRLFSSVNVSVLPIFDIGCCVSALLHCYVGEQLFNHC